MPKASPKKRFSKPLKFSRFSDVWLVLFAVSFGAVGSYYWLRTFAATSDSGYFPKTANVSGQEQAVLGSATSAAVIILASGPVAALIFWWIWRRSEMHAFAKLLLTLVPIMAVMALT